MAAPTKATILGKDPSTNKYTIRIPLLETSAGTEIYKTKATLCCEDGVLNPYNIGDVVYVVFEDDQYGSPVIIGKLSKEGLVDTQKNKPAASYKIAELSVLGNTQLSRNTKIGDISYNDITATIRQVGNMPEKITSVNGLSGGKLTSPLIFDGGDGLTANKIVLDQTKKGQITDTGTATILGFLNSNTLTVGGSGYKLNLRGSGTRPTYKGDDLALYSDIAATALPNFTKVLAYVVSGGTQANKFLSINYSGYTSESAAYFKMSAASCHGNGISYQFLEDILIGCSKDGAVTCNLYKYCQSMAASPYASYNYGDVFYVIDTTNKIVDFYILCGQYSHSYYTPITKIGNTTTAGITQYTSTPTVYSSGTKVWADGISSLIAKQSDCGTKLYRHKLYIELTTGSSYTGYLEIVSTDSTEITSIDKLGEVVDSCVSLWTKDIYNIRNGQVVGYIYDSSEHSFEFTGQNKNGNFNNGLLISSIGTDTVTPL